MEEDIVASTIEGINNVRKFSFQTITKINQIAIIEQKK